MEYVVGVGPIDERFREDFTNIDCTDDGEWRVGRDGVQRILTPRDRKIELVCFEKKTLVGLSRGALSRQHAIAACADADEVQSGG